MSLRCLFGHILGEARSQKVDTVGNRTSKYGYEQGLSITEVKSCVVCGTHVDVVTFVSEFVAHSLRKHYACTLLHEDPGHTTWLPVVRKSKRKLKK